MAKLRDYFKLFTYIFYPGIVIIFYLAQILEGDIGFDLIFCPTDLVFVMLVFGVYVLFDATRLTESKLFLSMKRTDGRYRLPIVFVFIIILVLLMSLYDDLKVYFYLNTVVGVNLGIVLLIWLGMLGCCYLIDRNDN